MLLLCLRPHTGPRFTTSLKRSPQTLLLSTSWKVDYPSLPPKADLLSTPENDFGRSSLSLGHERRPSRLFKNEGAARVYVKRIEDTFISLSRNRAGLATFRGALAK